MSKLTSRLLILVVVSSLFVTASRINSADAIPNIFITEDGSIVGTDSIQRSGNVYTFTANITGQIQVEKSDVTINGNGYTLSRPGDTPDSVGFTLYNISKVTILNTRVVNFTYGIVIGTLCSNNNITGNYLKDNVYSIQVTDYSPHNFITQNTIIGNTTTTTQTIGIECASYSTFNTISENTITDTYYGMKFDGSSGNQSIIRNTLTNSDYGMWLWGTSQNTISENTITNSYNWGIDLYPAHNNTIFNNKIVSSPSGGGIYLSTGSNNNVIRGNTIADTVSGLRVINSSNNRITQNNFIDNNIHVQPPSFADFVNSFDEGYPVGGNFWSNYTGVDFYKGTGQNVTGYDGIGDTSHVIEANNIDNYPLVGLFSSFEAYAGLRVEAVSNSTITNFAYTNENGTISMQVTNASSLQQSGFLRATISRRLIHEPFSVTIDAGPPQVLDLNDMLYYNATHRWIYLVYPHSAHEISIQGVLPDITPPAISILSPEAKAYNRRDIPLTFTINEPTSWTGFSLDGQSNATTTGNTTLTNLSDGTHAIKVYANDTEGNMGSSAIVNFSVDTTPPTIEILLPQNITYNARGVPLTFTLSEPTSWIGYSFDSTPNASIAGNTTITNLQDGSHTITIYANDTLGNMGRSNTIHFTILITSDDTTPPVISITSPENRTYTTETNTIDVPLTFNVNEPTMWTAYSLDNKPNMTTSGNTILTALTVGKHKIIVYALDTAGNDAASEEVNFTIEAQPQSQPFPPIWAIAATIIVFVSIALAVYCFRIRKAKHT
jgi:parallel beta-helix repeat protein